MNECARPAGQKSFPGPVELVKISKPDLTLREANNLASRNTIFDIPVFAFLTDSEPTKETWSNVHEL